MRWSEKSNRVGVMAKEELCEKVVTVRRVSDSVMAVVLFRLICGYTPQSQRNVKKTGFS